MADTGEHDSWRVTIEKLFGEGKLRSHQCIVYNKDSQSTATSEKCGCQRLVRQHSFDGSMLTEKPQRDAWNVQSHTQPLAALIYHSTASTKVRQTSIGLPLLPCFTNRFSFCDVHVRIRTILKPSMS